MTAESFADKADSKQFANSSRVGQHCHMIKASKIRNAGHPIESLFLESAGLAQTYSIYIDHLIQKYRA